MSVDGGVSFEQVGDAVTTNSTTLQKAVFAIKQTGSVRLEIHRESGSAKGLNIDDVEVTSFVVQNPGGSESDNNNYLFGNPSNARTVLDSANNYLLTRSISSCRITRAVLRLTG